MAQIEQQLQDALEENRIFNERLIEKEKLLEESNKQIESLNSDLEKEKLYAAELCKKIIELSDELATFSMKEDDEVQCNGGSDYDEHKEDIIELEHHLRKGSLTPICDLMLSCTLCGERIKLDELEPHSIRCSSGAGKRNSNGKEPTTPTLPGMMVATVTTSRRESTIVDNECPNFRVICKTTIPDFKKPLLVTERTKEDFLWFRDALEKLYPETIIPPLKFKEDLTGNLREAQRFLSRICVHNVLKCNNLTRKFFDASPRELEKIQKNFHRKVPERLKRQKPAVEVVDKDGLLFRTQTYISQLINNLESLMKYFKENKEKRSDGLSQCFLALSYGETNETYLQMMSKALSKIIGDLENKRDVSFITYGIYDESVLAEDLESILEYTKAANELLSRVESSINTYLYWEEEIRVFEEMKLEGLVTKSNGKSITQLWAEASSNCSIAKNDLEDMCRDLSQELTSYDMRKEHELKQIFIEYAESRYDVFETMQSKWFGVKLMLNSDILPEVRAIDLTT